MGLRWNDIDLNEKYFGINSARDNYDENKPKTETSTRKVYFDNSLLTLIKEYKNHERERLFKEGVILSDENYFILNSRDLPITRSRIAYMFCLLREKAEVQSIAVHGLRRIHTTFLIEAGTSIEYISTRLGYKNINVTLDVYNDALKEEEEETADLTDKLIENLQVDALQVYRIFPTNL